MYRYMLCSTAKLILLAVSLSGWSDPATARPAFPTEKTCPVPLADNAPGLWTPQELWAWDNRICLGKEADLSQRSEGEREDCEVTNSHNWPDDLIISSDFFETIIFHEPFTSATPRQGVRIKCALFIEEVDLSRGHSRHGIEIKDSRFNKAANFSDMRIDGALTFNKVTFDDALYASGLKTESNIVVIDTNFSSGASLRGASSTGSLSLISSESNSHMFFDNIKIAGDVLLSHSKFTHIVSFQDSAIGGGFRTFRSTFGDEDGVAQGFYLYGSNISNDVQLHESTFFSEINMDYSIIGGGVELYGSMAEDDFQNSDFRLGNSQVGSDVKIASSTLGTISLSNSTFGGGILVGGSSTVGTFSMTSAKVENSLSLMNGIQVIHVDLTGSRIGAFRLGLIRRYSQVYSGEIRVFLDEWPWSNLVLRNTKVESFYDMPDVWENFYGNLDIDGFTYQRLPNLPEHDISGMAGRPVDWLLNWLGMQRDHDKRYFPNIYDELADTLIREGYPSKANSILIAKNNHWRQSPSTPWIRKILLWGSWITIGYGYRNGLSLLWMIVLVTLGTWVAGLATDKLSEMSAIERFWFSADRLVPLLTLEEKHKNLSIPGWKASYFHIHQILGFTLATFFVAGLSGIAK